MNKSVLVSAVVGSIVNFALGAIIYGLLGLDAFMKTHMMHYEGLFKAMDGTQMVLIFVSGIFMSLLVAYIFSNWAHIHDFNAGLKAGALIGLLLTIGFDTFMYGYLNLWDLTAVCTDIIVSTIVTAVVAGCIAWMLGRMRPKDA